MFSPGHSTYSKSAFSRPKTNRYVKPYSRYPKRSRGMFKAMVPYNGNAVTDYRGSRIPIPRYLAPEPKEVSNYLSGTATNSGTALLLNGIAEGSDINERIGRRSWFRSFECIGTLVLPTSNNQAYDTIKVSLVLDMQPNNAAMTVSDCYDTATTGNLAQSFRSVGSAYRYKVLKSEQITLNSQEATRSNAYQFKWFLGLAFSTCYSSTDATVSSIDTNALYLVIGDQIGTTAAPTYTINARVGYVDM